MRKRHGGFYFDVNRRLGAENMMFYSMFDLNARDLAELLNQYRSRVLAVDQPS